MRNKLLLLALGSILILSSFTFKLSKEKQPRTIFKTSSIINGNQVEKKVILIDGKT